MILASDPAFAGQTGGAEQDSRQALEVKVGRTCAVSPIASRVELDEHLQVSGQSKGRRWR